MSNSAYVTLKSNLSICKIANENKHYIPETLVTSGTRDTERRQTRKNPQHTTQKTNILSNKEPTKQKGKDVLNITTSKQTENKIGKA